MRILIADDHAIVRKGLISLLRTQFHNATIEEVADGSDAVEKTRQQRWDVIILDISMPGMNGIDALKQIRADGVATPVLILSMQREDQYAIRALKAGASGYVKKDCAYEELIGAINKVTSGRKYISESLSEKIASNISGLNGKLPHELLSDREMQVMEQIAAGKTISEIAAQINLSVNTISTYRARILDKLALNTNAEITRYAFDNNLV